MKTIFKNGEYERVPDEVAENAVKHKGFKYVSKSEWKINTRPVLELKEEEPKVEKETKKSYQKKKKS